MRNTILALALLAVGGHAFAQQHAPADVMKIAHAAGGGAPGGAQIQIEYIAAEFGGGVVKGAPYSAESVTETTQTLADGNRIARKSAAAVYRDSQGRTRRDQTVGSIGLLAVQAGEPLRLITIGDPVAGVSYTLDPRTQTATKMTLQSTVSHVGLPGGVLWVQREASEDVFEVALPPPPAGAAQRVVETTVIRHATQGQGATEQLGKQVMEGVEVEGTRETTSIPAGQMGNERAIDMVFERWYSPRLQTVVMSRRSDPRMGDTVYRLTNISLSEPPASLFQVPAGYTVKEGPQKDQMLIIRKEQQ
jgi:hypothetical protein